MKSDFLLAITQLSAEKNLPKEVVLSAVESALVSAYRKDNFAPNQNISAKINPNNGRVEVWAEKTVVEHPSDSRLEISTDEAHKIKPDAQIGDALMVEATPPNAGRIAAQTAKQVILQRLHEAEHSAILEEYSEKEEEVLFEKYISIKPKMVIETADKEKYLEAMRMFSDTLSKPVHEFFDKVFVNVDDERVKNNRLSLARAVNRLFVNNIADLKEIVVQKV